MTEWYKDIIFYLKYGQFPNGMSSKERRALKMKENQYVLVAEILFRRNFDGMLLRCIDSMKSQKVLVEFHVFIIWLSFMSNLEEASKVWFWYPKLNEEHGHEGHSKCKKEPHRWIILFVLFPMICGTSCISSRLWRYDFVKL
jgi:hypothetical protein